MPNNDFTFVLKWIERLFSIDYVLPDTFNGATSIYDTNKSFGISGIYADGKQELVPITRFPHYTYSAIIKNKENIVTVPKPDPEPNSYKFKVEDNTVTITTSLASNSYVRKDLSYYKIKGIKTPENGYADDIILFPLNDNYDRYLSSIEGAGTETEKGEETFKVTFKMPKANILFFLNVGYLRGSFILKIINYGNESKDLEPGEYNFWCSGGAGGKGGDHYWENRWGKHDFSAGGNGGAGGTFDKRDTNSSTSPPKNGNGANGEYGWWSAGTSSQLGAGGTGYNIFAFKDRYDTINSTRSEEKSTFPKEFQPGLDGYLYIQKM